MTKTLTEQWREGTLEYRYYYVKHTFGWKSFGITIDFWHGQFDKWGAIPNDYVKEVLAPVPSYDEYKELVRKSDKLDKIMSDTVTNQGDCQQIVEDNLNRKIARLQKQLAIATKALKGVCVWANTGNGGEKAVKKVCEKALKEMEGVK